MTLTVKQCELLISMFNASISRAVESGIPIGQEYYSDLDEIKSKLYTERQEAISREIRKEKGGNRTWF